VRAEGNKVAQTVTYEWTQRKFAFLFTVVVVLYFTSGGQDNQRPTLFAQSAGHVLNSGFTNPDISFLLLDAHTGAVLAWRWEDAEQPIPLGSLVKPFTALAYAEQHAYCYPTHTCRGKASGCWFPHGHGQVDLTSAIAYSCNSYFRMLTTDMTGADLLPVTQRFDLEPPIAGANGIALVGLNTQWTISPLKIARAYLELIRRRNQPGVRRFLLEWRNQRERGLELRLSARSDIPMRWLRLEQPRVPTREMLRAMASP
jgi:hypothetical protein